ncbi:unnamed protein product [Brassica oleracea var. botrytis]
MHLDQVLGKMAIEDLEDTIHKSSLRSEELCCEMSSCLIGIAVPQPQNGVQVTMYKHLRIQQKRTSLVLRQLSSLCKTKKE